MSVAQQTEKIPKSQRTKSVEGHLGLLKARIVKLRRGHVESIMCSCAAKG